MRDRSACVELSVAVLRLLFRDAQAWWYHQYLREQGGVAEPRRRERRTVCRHVEALRQAKILHVGPGGWVLYRDRGRLEGHGGMEDLFVKARWRHPVLDPTEAADGTIRALLEGPSPSDEPGIALRHAQALGASVHNAPRRDDSG